jgi:hypothetical protein
MIHGNSATLMMLDGERISLGIRQRFEQVDVLAHRSGGDEARYLPTQSAARSR